MIPKFREGVRLVVPFRRVPPFLHPGTVFRACSDTRNMFALFVPLHSVQEITQNYVQETNQRLRVHHCRRLVESG